MEIRMFRKYSVELSTPFGSVVLSWLTRPFWPWAVARARGLSVGAGTLSLAVDWHELWWDNCA